MRPVLSSPTLNLSVAHQQSGYFPDAESTCACKRQAFIKEYNVGM